MEIKKELKLIRMNEVEATEIDWLWYPYIPYGKIIVIQGDSGSEYVRDEDSIAGKKKIPVFVIKKNIPACI